MTRRDLTVVLERAGGKQENIRDPEAFREAWKKALVIESLSQNDIALVKDFESRHPDFFPPDTSLEKKINHVKNIGKIRADEEFERRENFRKLDARTEQITAERALRDRGVEVLQSGDPAVYFLEQYRRLHLGDENVMHLVLLVTCCQQCDHSFGVHPALDGLKGSGKSSAISAALYLLPEEYVYTGTFSPRGLYYSDLKPGTIVFSDDTLPDEDLIGILKRSMSAFHEPTAHITVNKDRKAEELTIPPETVFILTSVGTSVDDQLRDRQVVVQIDKNLELDQRYVNFLAERALTGETPRNLTDEVMVCREIVRIIKSARFRVLVPFADRIQFSDEAMENRRAINLFYDYLWSAAILHYQTRQHEERDGVIQVVATEDDFRTANTLFPQSEYQWNLKLSKREKQVFDLMAKAGSHGIEESRIVETLKVDKGYVHRLLHGEPKRNLAGLVDKAPVTFEREFNRDTGRHNNIWKVTRELRDGLSSFAILSSVDPTTTDGQPKRQPTFKRVS
jgi:hypothetical protein